MNNTRAFTLVELLTVMSIVAVLATISLFAIGGARSSARDARRKADLESIRSALELHRSDCGDYPTSLPNGATFVGGAGCNPVGNTYIQMVPVDPSGGNYIYNITNSTDTAYELCATLEDPPASPSSCTGGGNYRVTSP